MQTHLSLTTAGWSLLQLLLILAIISTLSMLSTPLYRLWVKHSRLYQAHAALLTNSHILQQHYQRHLSYQTRQQQWPKLAITHTAFFCIRPQSDPDYKGDNHYTLKAVAFDPSSESRVLKINQDGNLLICASSQSRCDDPLPFFKGGSNIDQQCKLFHS